MVYFLLGVLLIGICYFLFAKPSKKRKPVATHSEPAPRREPEAQPVIRCYVPGPKLTASDDALYAVIYAAVAKTLEAEGINPEGGFTIKKMKLVHDADAPSLSLKENEALFAVILAAIGQALAAEGVNPEGGFVIRSITPVPC